MVSENRHIHPVDSEFLSLRFSACSGFKFRFKFAQSKERVLGFCSQGGWRIRITNIALSIFRAAWGASCSSNSGGKRYTIGPTALISPPLHNQKHADGSRNADAQMPCAFRQRVKSKLYKRGKDNKNTAGKMKKDGRRERALQKSEVATIVRRAFSARR
jgi:hypothetical protein